MNNTLTLSDLTTAYITKRSGVLKANDGFLKNMSVAHFDSHDKDRINVLAVILSYKGDGSRRALVNAAWAYVDIGRIGPSFIEVWPRGVIEQYGNAPIDKTPFRCAINGDRVYKVE